MTKWTNFGRAIIAASLFTLVVSCEEPTRKPDVGESEQQPAASPPAEPKPTQSVISERRIFFVEGSEEEMQQIRARYSEDDYATVMDDAMYYRATAYEYLETLGIPITRVTQKQPLTFRVGSATRTYDLRDSEWLDVIVLYREDQEPRLIAPVDVHVANEYFGIPRASSDSAATTTLD